MIRARMFGDWDNDSRGLIDRLRDQTEHFEGDTYGDILFVDDDSYHYAMVFNYADPSLYRLGTVGISLILEPPEIYAVRENPHSFKTYSFCDDGHRPAYGLGFATIPRDHQLKTAGRSQHLCMITSNKRLTEYHNRRHQIREALLESDIDMDFYGRGMGRSEDNRVRGEIPPMQKQLVLDQYEFVIDFENSPRNVVTDKFFDPVLCGTVPVTNSTWLRDNYPNSVVFVDFEQPTEQIVDQIRELSIRGRASDYDIMIARNDILSGKLCLAKWIEERIKET